MSPKENRSDKDIEEMYAPTTSNFDSILSLLQSTRDRIINTVNTEIIDLYWQIGKEGSEKARDGGWGKTVVEELSS